MPEGRRWLPSVAETPAAESMPPSQGVGSATIVRAPRRALWIPAAVPPVPPPTTRTSVSSTAGAGPSPVGAPITAATANSSPVRIMRLPLPAPALDVEVREPEAAGAGDRILVLLPRQPPGDLGELEGAVHRPVLRHDVDVGVPGQAGGDPAEDLLRPADVVRHDEVPDHEPAVHEAVRGGAGHAHLPVHLQDRGAGHLRVALGS